MNLRPIRRYAMAREMISFGVMCCAQTKDQKRPLAFLAITFVLAFAVQGSAQTPA